MKGSLCRLAETSFLWRDTAMRIREHFNPRAPFEARRGGRLAPASNDRFNPRAPCGARPARFWRTFWSIPISIHAPLAGRDRQSTSLVHDADISTHAPLARRDYLPCRPPGTAWDFNPRAPCGARPVVGSRSTKSHTFQPTRPLRGATIRMWRPFRSCAHFNPRAPCGARPN